LSEKRGTTDIREQVPEKTAAGAHKRILLVDDNADATDMLRDMLTDLGYQVAVAYDGPQALSALESFQADVAVIDIGLPVMDGYELAGHIRGAAMAPDSSR
jgi:CheY-like chemotaxis protein